jgi:hypothetical protein
MAGLFRPSNSEGIRSLELSIDDRPIVGEDLLTYHILLNCVIDIAVGDVIANRSVNRWFKFKFELGSMKSFLIFSRCTLCYARYVIAKCASLPFEKVELFSDQRFANPVDLRRVVTEYCVTDKEVFYVPGPSISRTWRRRSDSKS